MGGGASRYPGYLSLIKEYTEEFTPPLLMKPVEILSVKNPGQTVALGALSLGEELTGN